MAVFVVVILKTSVTEGALLKRLIGRGRQADVPGYWSLHSYDWDKGKVYFEQLDRESSVVYTVGVAGSEVFVSSAFARTVVRWLNGWHIDHQREEMAVANSEEAQALLRQRREVVGVSVQQRQQWHSEMVEECRRADRVLLAEHADTRGGIY